MPDVNIRNETPQNLNVAFRFVAPASWTNALQAGECWTTHLASTPYTIEVRVDHENNRFSAGESWSTAGDIVGGWFAGAASVGLGIFGAANGVSGMPAIGAAGGLMNHAISAGSRFAENAAGMVVTIGGVWIPFNNKTYAVRFDEHQGYSLWDVDNNYRM